MPTAAVMVGVLPVTIEEVTARTLLAEAHDGSSRPGMCLGLLPTAIAACRKASVGEGNTGRNRLPEAVHPPAAPAMYADRTKRGHCGFEFD